MSWVRAVWKENEEEMEEVLPNHWVDVPDRRVFWPRSSNPLRLIKDRKTPGKTWYNFTLVKIKFSSDDRDECLHHDLTTDAETEVGASGRIKTTNRQLDFVYEGDSGDVCESPSVGPGLQSDDSDLEVPAKKRKKKNPAVSSDTDEDDLGSPVIPLPPPPKELKNGSAKKHHFDRVKSRTSTTPLHSSTDRSPSGVDPVCRTPTNNKQYCFPSLQPTVTPVMRTPTATQSSPFSPSLQPARKNPDVAQVNKTPNSIRSPGCVTITSQERPAPSLQESQLTAKGGRQVSTAYPMPEARFQRKVLQLLVEIRDSIKMSKPAPDRNVHILETCDTLGELEDLEELLEDQAERQALVNKLSRVGGKKTGFAVQTIMNRMLTNEVMSHFNLTGKHGKRAFEKLNLYRVVRDSAMASQDTATEAEINTAISQHLKYAPDRRGGGGRKK